MSAYRAPLAPLAKLAPRASFWRRVWAVLRLVPLRMRARRERHASDLDLALVAIRWETISGGDLPNEERFLRAVHRMRAQRARLVKAVFEELRLTGLPRGLAREAVAKIARAHGRENLVAKIGPPPTDIGA